MLVCLVGSRSVLVGFCCVLGLLGASIDGVQSLWTQMFSSVIDVAILGCAWEVKGKRGTSLLLCFFFIFY